MGGSNDWSLSSGALAEGEWFLWDKQTFDENQDLGQAVSEFAAPTKNPDSAQSMVERIIRRGPASHAEALKELRAAFPDSPLTVRVAALAILMRRGAGDHIPR